MTSSLVDSNILIDLLDKSTAWGPWSFRQLDRVSREGSMIINQIVFAETAMYFLEVREIDRVLATLKITREDLPWPAAAAAGLVHVKYRKQGGGRERVLPDFLIGAHAQNKGHRLLTRDASRYRAYFPDLDIIAPDSHP